MKEVIELMGANIPWILFFYHWKTWTTRSHQ